MTVLGAVRMPKASRSIDVEVSPDAFMEVVCDFERYPDFVDSVLAAELEWCDRDQWRAAFEVVVLRRHIRYRLDLRRDGHRLLWDLVDGDHMRHNQGSWLLLTRDDETTRAIYTIDVEFDTFVPLAMQGLLMDATIPRMLREFKRRAETLVGETLASY